MLSLRITAPDGSVRAIPLTGPEVTLGRAPDNRVVLDGNGVSSHHCAFMVQGNQCVLQDRGSTNGTFVNNARVQQSNPLAESDRIYVGQYLLQVLHGAGGVSAHPMTMPHAIGGAPPPPAGGVASSILIQRGDRAWRDEYNRLQRYAEQWDEAGRPDRLALRPHELRRAREWIAKTPAEQQGAITPLQRELIQFSGGANTRTSVKKAATIGGAVLGLGAIVALAVVLWPESKDEPEPDPGSKAGVETEAPPPPEDDGSDEVVETPRPRTPKHHEKPVEHSVIPQESLDDIAQRYGVSVSQIADWNLLNPDEQFLPEGTKVKINKPTKRPLPQQKINYELERGDKSWTKLSKRFGISAKKLRSYNPDVNKLKKGQEVVIWIDPKPYKPREPRQAIPEYVPERTAQAIGSPNSGRLEKGIQLPDNPALYKRRYPYIMWGSGYLIANVQKAVAQFRQDMDFDGTLVLADISKKRGGDFYPPHRSHQTGRDIDIWLPTLRGVFKEKYLTEDGDEKWGRRPNPDEVDWFATWGLIRALLDTGAVQQIFLSDSVQPRVYDAAKFLGVSDEELDEVLQYPKGQGTKPGIVIHSPGHSHHMHVRFQCAPYERECIRQNSRDAHE